MSDPWLHIIGIGEDGLAGLSPASRAAIADAVAVFGGSRHLELADAGARGHAWPVPFDWSQIVSYRGKRTVVLASGDPFWHGAGGSIVPHLASAEWTAHPAPSTFSLAAARLGWRLEETVCLGLHAASFTRLAPVLHEGARIICLVRDGEAAVNLAQWLKERQWGNSTYWALSAIGGPREQVARASVADYADALPPRAPVAVAIEARGNHGLPRCSGLADELFQNDGQLTKRPVRALALSALSPRPGERLWDIGAGCGSISIEWALAGGRAIAIEQSADRLANIAANLESFGVAHRVRAVQACAPEGLADLDTPDAIFIGGGLSETLVQELRTHVAAGTRVVAHAVSIESQALLSALHARHGGQLIKIELAEAEPLGRMRSWRASRSITQWSGTL